LTPLWITIGKHHAHPIQAQQAVLSFSIVMIICWAKLICRIFTGLAPLSKTNYLNFQTSEVGKYSSNSYSKNASFIQELITTSQLKKKISMQTKVILLRATKQYFLFMR
jgi:hypothetical protein